MERKLRKRKLYNSETGIKKKRKNHGAETVNAMVMNENILITNNLHDSNMVDWDFNTNEGKLSTKGIKSHSTGLFENGVSVGDKCTTICRAETRNKDGEVYENQENKDSEHIDIQVLRESLSSTKALDMLRKFVKICNNNKGRDLAAEYLNSGGNILEILRVLDTIDKKGIGAAITVFSVMRILLIKILSEYPQYQSSAEGACRHLINSHLSLVHSMLSVQSNVKQRKVILQLLAVVVSLGGNLPRDLLNHLFIPPEVIKSLLQHTKPTDNQNVRNCFIHFVLAFLIGGNVPIIRALLDKRVLLSNIFYNLKYDSKDIVALVLTTLRTYILQNASVSKTMKLQIFSTSVIQNLVYLYNWKGPNNWPHLKTQIVLPNPQYLSDKEGVTEMVHDFLILLLTSHRHGIIFHDHLLGTTHVKHNQIVNTVLQSLDRPWEHEKPTKLVIQILAACPDLIKSQFSLLEPYIEPRVSHKWIAAMKFIKEIIQSLDVQTCIKTCSLQLNVTQLANALISLTIPTGVMKQAIIPSLNHSNIIVRHEAVLLLTSMLNQIQKHLSVLNIVYKEGGKFFIFKNILIQFMIKNMPNLNIILKVWTDTFTLDPDVDNINKEPIPEPKKHEHLMTTLNLLHLYHEVCPKLLDILPNVLPDTFLEPLNNLDNIAIDDFIATKVKAIQILIILYPNEFLPHQEIFKSALSFLISVINKGSPSIALSIKTTMKTLLNTTGLFEGCTDHLDIWINCFTNLNSRKKLTKWFICAIKETAQNIERYVSEVIEAEEIVNEDVVQLGGLESLFNELMTRSNTDENVENDVLHMQRFTSVSPLLCCMLHKAKEDLHPSISSYLSYVLIHTLHYQVTPQCLIHLAKDVVLPVKEYLLSWLDGGKPAHIEKIFSSMTLMCNVNSVFLSDTKLQITEIFNGDNTVIFHYNNQNITIHHSVSTYQIKHLFKMAIFYLAQFIKRGVLTETQYSNYKIFLISLLHIANSNSNNYALVDECARSILMHPIILHYFSPIYKKSESMLGYMTNLLILDICKTVSHLCKQRNIRSLFVHFKNKLVAQLCKIMEKQRKSNKIHDFETIAALLEVLLLTAKDIVHLLNRLIELESTMLISKDAEKLSIFGYMIPKLLNIINKNYMGQERCVFFELDAEFIRRLFLHLLFLKTNSFCDFEMWETAIYTYLLKFSHNIAGINANMFASLLMTKMADTTVKLLSFLINKFIRFIPTFTEAMMDIQDIEKVKIILPVLASNLKIKWNLVFLHNLRKHCEIDIINYLCNPKDTNPWIEGNIAAIRYLINSTFDIKICTKICNTILQIGDKLDMVSIHYLKLLESVFNKSADLETGSENSITNFIQVLLHIITLTLKSESKNIQKLNILSEALMKAVQRLKERSEDSVCEKLSSHHSWPQFTRFSLKFGLKIPKNNEASVAILQTLTSLCNIAYKENSNNEYVKILFEMATSHSEFINIMLGSSSTKRDLVELLWVLMQKNKSVMALTHLPVYFAAYSATLNEADQFILFILRYYESNDINFHDYRPYIWGNAAAIHYSVKGETHTNLWRQPSITQVLNLFEEEKVLNTIRNYPVDRALQDRKVCKGNNIYDPAFYLPLLCFLLSENNVVSCQKVAQSGALALTIIACSSKHSDVRMVAYTIIARYYAHLEASRGKAKLLWMRLIDAMRYGIVSQQLELKDMRLNCLVSTFLARTSLIATQPLHPLYSTLHTFLMAKPALDINTIPELLQLYHSCDLQHKVHRYWILECVRDSMKTESELDVAFKCVLFKMLLDFYTCTLSDSNTKKLILEIIDATLNIPKACVFFLQCHGLLPWLSEVARSAHKWEAQHVDLTVKIMDKLLNTILNMKGDVVHYKVMLANTATCLNLRLLRDMRISTFTFYINILQKLVLSRRMKLAITKRHIIEILDFSKQLLGNIDECEDILRFGCEFVTNVDCLDNDDEVEVAKNSLRTLVWTWCAHADKENHF